MMKKISRFFVSILLVALLFPGISQALCIDVGAEFPDISLPTIDGKTVSIKDFRGKIVLLAFWASWCPRCREELIFLEGIYRSNPDVVVLAVNQESQNLSNTHLENLKKLLEEWRIDYPVLLDRDLKAWSALCINALPTSVILDKKGMVRFAEPNYYWESQEKIGKVLQELKNE